MKKFNFNLEKHTPKSAFFIITSIVTVYLLVVTLLISSCTHKPENVTNTDTQPVDVSQNGGTNTTPTPADVQFLMEVTQVNMEEIKLGKLAQQKGNIADVKEMGKMMEDEHTKSLNEVKELAAKKSITLPTDVSEKGKKDYEELNSKNGKDFDKVYSDKMVKGHKETIAKFENAALSSDVDIKNWATATLPVLKKHLEHAEHCQMKTK